MTSLLHDDSIEILSSSATRSGPNISHVVDIGLSLMTAGNAIQPIVPIYRPNTARRKETSGRRKSSFATAGRKNKKKKNDDKKSMKEKRIKNCVMAVATFMILASMILVGASLSMSDHIDEMVRQMNGLTTNLPTTTSASIKTTAAFTTSSSSSPNTSIIASISKATPFSDRKLNRPSVSNQTVF